MLKKFEWDGAKASSNFCKHGLSFATATETFDDPNHLILPTVRAGDGEDRFKAIGLIENRLYAVVFVERGDSIRFISARRANKQETKRYGDRLLHP